MNISTSNFNGNRWLRVNNRYFGHCPAGVKNVAALRVGKFVYINTADTSIVIDNFGYLLCVALVLSAAKIILW